MKYFYSYINSSYNFEGDGILDLEEGVEITPRFLEEEKKKIAIRVMECSDKKAEKAAAFIRFVSFNRVQ